MAAPRRPARRPVLPCDSGRGPAHKATLAFGGISGREASFAKGGFKTHIAIAELKGTLSGIWADASTVSAPCTAAKAQAALLWACIRPLPRWDFAIKKQEMAQWVVRFVTYAGLATRPSLKRGMSSRGALGPNRPASPHRRPIAPAGAATCVRSPQRHGGGLLRPYRATHYCQPCATTCISSCASRSLSEKTPPYRATVLPSVAT